MHKPHLHSSLLHKLTEHRVWMLFFCKGKEWTEIFNRFFFQSPSCCPEALLGGEQRGPWKRLLWCKCVFPPNSQFQIAWLLGGRVCQETVEDAASTSRCVGVSTLKPKAAESSLVMETGCMTVAAAQVIREAVAPCPSCLAMSTLSFPAFLYQGQPKTSGTWGILQCVSSLLNRCLPDCSSPAPWIHKGRGDVWRVGGCVLGFGDRSLPVSTLPHFLPL